MGISNALVGWEQIISPENPRSISSGTIVIPLSKSTVHQDIKAVCLQQMAGAGNRLFTAQVYDVWFFLHSKLKIAFR
jgi:hypothetical protein